MMSNAKATVTTSITVMMTNWSITGHPVPELLGHAPPIVHPANQVVVVAASALELGRHRPEFGVKVCFEIAAFQRPAAAVLVKMFPLGAAVLPGPHRRAADVFGRKAAFDFGGERVVAGDCQGKDDGVNHWVKRERPWAKRALVRRCYLRRGLIRQTAGPAA